MDSDLDGAGEQFIRNLFLNDLVLFSNSDDLNKAVGTRDAKSPPVGFGTYFDRRDNKEEGWALQVANDVAPANGILFPAVLAVADKRRIEATAQLAIDFMFGDDSADGGPAFRAASTCRATMPPATASPTTRIRCRSRSSRPEPSTPPPWPSIARIADPDRAPCSNAGRRQDDLRRPPP